MPLKHYLYQKEHASFYSKGSETSFYKSLCCVQKDATSLDQQILDMSLWNDDVSNAVEKQSTPQTGGASNTNPLLLSWLAALEPYDPFHGEDDECDSGKNDELLSRTAAAGTPHLVSHGGINHIQLLQLPENHKTSMAKKIHKLIKKIKKLAPHAKSLHSFKQQNHCNKTKSKTSEKH